LNVPMMASLVLPMYRVGNAPPGWSGRGIGRCGDGVVGFSDGAWVQSPPFSVTAMRAAFSSTIAWFSANIYSS
jgi:hypothetical protein